MAIRRDELTVFTPLPPERNGIADYAFMLLNGLAEHYECRAACTDWMATAPKGVRVVDEALAHRGGTGRVLHQIGNNPGHGFVLRAMRRLPGVTTLHDPGLLYLYEASGEPPDATRAGLIAPVADLALTYGRHDRESGIRTRANHLLFDHAAETLARSRAVVVHSEFARNRLRLIHGAAATRHIAVIPHMLPDHPMPERGAARARLGLAPDAVLIVTAGFATAAKRFDWVIAAMAEALPAAPRLTWIHAGPERPEEFDLTGAIAARPALRDRAVVAGYLDEAALDDHIAAADLLINLRFPSSGESSGTLARAFAAGACCIVSDTAAYAELPRDAVLHLPLAGTVPALARILEAVGADPERATDIGAECRAWAATEMSLRAVAARYRDVIEASLADPPSVQPLLAPAEAVRDRTPPLIALQVGSGLDRAAIAAALAGQQGRRRLLLAMPDLAMLAEFTLRHPALLMDLLPVQVRLRETRVQAAPEPGLLLDLEVGFPA